MEASDIRRIVQEEILRGEAFDNFHGITPQNVREFLVEPFCIRANLDDLEAPLRDMWVVLRERLPAEDGYAVAYDPLDGNWAVVERGGSDYVLVCSARSFAAALTSM